MRAAPAVLHQDIGSFLPWILLLLVLAKAAVSRRALLTLPTSPVLNSSKASCSFLQITNTESKR